MILEREGWKITNNLTLFLPDNNTVYLVDSEGLNKRDLLKLKRDIGGSRELRTDHDSFKLRLRPDLRFEIMVENSWRLVKNQIGIDYVGFIMSQVDSREGVLDGDFEVIVCPTRYPGKVFFVTEKMKEYDSCFNEMMRIANCSMFKKTRKWIPGHRYDSLKETYFYLGEYSVNQSGDVDASTYSNPPILKHLVIKEKKGCTSIKEVFLTRPYEYGNIQSLEKLPLMVDGGEALKNDMDGVDLMDLRYSMFTEFLPQGLSKALSSLTYSIIDVEDKIKDIIVDEYKKSLLKILIAYWNVCYSTCLGNSDNDLDQNTKEAIRLTCKYINPINVFSNIYYTDLLKEIGIDIVEITKDIVKNFKLEKQVFSDFKTYLENKDLYFKYRGGSTISVCQKVKSRSYGDSESKKLNNIFTRGYLAQEIINMINEATSESSFDVTSYQVYNGYTIATVTLGDIVRRRKGVDNIPENLKNEILEEKFQKISIEFDNGATIV